ncbi:MAG TPA: hypothetical protein VHW02_12415 [Rhizomicrobium sp.]|nr:hypothetical protein [Rhizomicrobium sp.]
MDASETLVKAYLNSLDFAVVQYEPDGNVPPDFLCDAHIAVEVRRLNQNYDDGNGPRGLEEVDISLWQNVRELILSMGVPTEGKTWGVFYRFSRPLPKWKRLKSAIENELRKFMNSGNQQPCSVTVQNNFHMKVYRYPIAKPTFFVPLGNSDEQRGGWLIEEIEKNLRYCIEEKEKKISSFRNKYKEWWLVLPDHIGLGLDEIEREIFRDQFRMTHTFDKVVLLDPRDCRRSFEV